MAMTTMQNYLSLIVVLACLYQEAESKCSGKQPLMLRLSNCTNTQPGVDSWGAFITAAGQRLCAMPSAFTNNIYLMGTDLCDDDAASGGLTFAQCQSRRGGTFNVSIAQSDKQFSSASQDDLTPDNNWLELNQGLREPYGRPGQLTLEFPIDLNLSQTLVGVVTEGQNHNLAHIGLQQESAKFLKSLEKQGYPSGGWSLNAGSTSVANPRPGHIVFGGFDRESVRGAFTTFPINYNIDNGSERYCPFEVEIQNMEIRYPGMDAGNDTNPRRGGILISSPKPMVVQYPPTQKLLGIIF